MIINGEVILSWRLQHDNGQLMWICSVLIGFRVCRRPSWTPKTKPNGHFSMAGWFCFWCSTRLLMPEKKWTGLRVKPCTEFSPSDGTLLTYETVRHEPVCAALFSGMSNRVEHQKLNQVGAGRPPPGWVFGVQLGLRQTQALDKTKTIKRGKVPPAILLSVENYY